MTLAYDVDVKARITVSLPPELIAAAQQAVREGRAVNVSAYVADAIRAYEAPEVAWRDVVEEILEETGGPPTPDEIAWADGVLKGTIDASELP